MKRIVVIGATSAIAQATARLYAKEKAAFVVVGRDEARTNSVRDDLLVRGASNATTVVVDFSDHQSHAARWREMKDALDGPVDIVLVAHGLLGVQAEAENDVTRALAIIDANFLSVVSLVNPAANDLAAQKSGTIALISSVAGDRGRQSNYIYGTAKAAVTTYAQGLRNRLFHHGVHVVTIKPGPTDTPMTAHLKQSGDAKQAESSSMTAPTKASTPAPKGGRMASPDDVARGIVNAIAKKKNVAYLPSKWWLIMNVIRHIPEAIFKRLKL